MIVKNLEIPDVLQGLHKFLRDRPLSQKQGLRLILPIFRNLPAFRLEEKPVNPAVLIGGSVDLFIAEELAVDYPGKVISFQFRSDGLACIYRGLIHRGLKPYLVGLWLPVLSAIMTEYAISPFGQNLEGEEQEAIVQFIAAIPVLIG